MHTQPERALPAGIAAVNYVALIQLTGRGDVLPASLLSAVVCQAVAIPLLLFVAFGPTMQDKPDGPPVLALMFGLLATWLQLGFIFNYFGTWPVTAFGLMSVVALVGVIRYHTKNMKKPPTNS